MSLINTGSIQLGNNINTGSLQLGLVPDAPAPEFNLSAEGYYYWDALRSFQVTSGSPERIQEVTELFATPDGSRGNADTDLVKTGVDASKGLKINGQWLFNEGNVPEINAAQEQRINVRTLGRPGQDAATGVIYLMFASLHPEEPGYAYGHNLDGAPNEYQAIWRGDEGFQEGNPTIRHRSTLGAVLNTLSTTPRPRLDEQLDWQFCVIKSDGATTTIEVNGVVQTLTGDANVGLWRSSIANMNDIFVGCLQAGTTLYKPVYVKFILDSASLTPQKELETKQFLRLQHEGTVNGSPEPKVRDIVPTTVIDNQNGPMPYVYSGVMAKSQVTPNLIYNVSDRGLTHYLVDDHHEVVLYRSVDGGNAWAERTVVIPADPGNDIGYTNPGLGVFDDGTAIICATKVFYPAAPRQNQSIVFYRCNDIDADDLTWSLVDEVVMPQTGAYNALLNANCQIVKDQNGNLHACAYYVEGEFPFAGQDVYLRLLTSTNNGLTWALGTIIDQDVWSGSSNRAINESSILILPQTGRMLVATRVNGQNFHKLYLSDDDTLAAFSDFGEERFGTWYYAPASSDSSWSNPPTLLQFELSGQSYIMFAAFNRGLTYRQFLDNGNNSSFMDGHLNFCFAREENIITQGIRAFINPSSRRFESATPFKLGDGYLSAVFTTGSTMVFRTFRDRIGKKPGEYWTPRIPEEYQILSFISILGTVVS